MKLEYTIFPKGQSSVTFLIAYSEKLDNGQPDGIWNIDTNQILLSLQMYRQFNKLETTKEKIAFFNSLKKISNLELK